MNQELAIARNLRPSGRRVCQTGGLLSLVMQKQPILESPHFWTGTALLGVLAINGLIAFSGFAGNKDALRITHAYLGTLAISIMLIHGILGLKLGLSI